MAEEVHLGLPGPWAADYRETADHYTTKIGGVPDWPTGDMSIKPEMLQCSLCGTKLCLVAQVYAPVVKLNIEERIIYVLVCPTPECGPKPQSWKVIRVQKCRSIEQTASGGDELGQATGPASTSVPEEQVDKQKSSDINDDDFDLDALAEALEQAATLASNSKKKSKSKRANAPIKHPVLKEKARDLSVPVLPCFYIYYDKEQYRGKGAVGSNSNELVLDKEITDATNDEEEKYEYDKAIGADRTFLKFKKRLDAYPEQCFRYCYGGKPLSAATKLQDAGTCRLCGSSRHWTWLTLIIYTCSKSCCPSSCGAKPSSCCWGVAEEEIVIQEDEAV
ncbi:unnamed protein product [Urochloa humidicola]